MKKNNLFLKLTAFLFLLGVLSCSVYATEIDSTYSYEQTDDGSEDMMEDDIEDEDFEDEPETVYEPDDELNSTINVTAVLDDLDTSVFPVNGIHVVVSNYDIDTSYEAQLNEDNNYSASIPVREGTYDVNTNVTSDFSGIYYITLDGVDTGSIQVGDTVMNTGYYIDVIPHSEYEIVAHVMRNESAQITDTNLAPELPDKYKDIVSGKYSESKAKESMAEEDEPGSGEVVENDTSFYWIAIVIILILIIALCLGAAIFIKRIRNDEED